MSGPVGEMAVMLCGSAATEAQRRPGMTVG
jgi:hypothetical protein